MWVGVKAGEKAHQYNALCHAVMCDHGCSTLRQALAGRTLPIAVELVNNISRSRSIDSGRRRGFVVRLSPVD